MRNFTRALSVHACATFVKGVVNESTSEPIPLYLQSVPRSVNTCQRAAYNCYIQVSLRYVASCNEDSQYRPNSLVYRHSVCNQPLPLMQKTAANIRTRTHAPTHTVATDSILPVQFSRRRTADPSRRQRILQERWQGRATEEKEERDRRRDEREEEHKRRAASLSHHTPSHPHSRHHHSPVKRRKRKEREHQPLEEVEEAERPDISAPDNAESRPHISSSILHLASLLYSLILH